jgi:hypothetical protein
MHGDVNAFEPNQKDRHIIEKKNQLPITNIKMA